MDDDRTIVLKVFDNVLDAELARGYLESHGVMAAVRRADDAGMKPLRNREYGVQLIVLRSSKETAEEILQSMNS